MANIKSAEKRHRQSLKRRARNTYWRSSVKTAMKKVREAAAAKDPKAPEALREAEKILKKAASKGVVHPRAADRNTSRLAKLVHRTAAAAK